MIRAVLTDIEGTTSSLSFVKDVLFPYARAAMSDFIAARGGDPAVIDILNEVRALEENPGLTDDNVAAVLVEWIDLDRKVTPLKTIQGMIWRAGYESGAITGHIYDDAADALRRWHAAGVKLYVYSSGSVAAQKLLFAHTAFGDLTPLFSGYFDTVTGPKLEAASYGKIAQAIGMNPAEILFLSDNTAEIDAARGAGMATMVLNRPQDLNAPPEKLAGYEWAADFTKISIKENAA